MNSCNFVGNLGREWEVAYTQDGKCVAKNSLATKKYNGETVWVNIVAFAKRAETLAQYTSKGSPLAVTTEFSPSDYEKDGIKKHFSNFVITGFTFIGNNNNQQQGSHQQHPGGGYKQPQTQGGYQQARGNQRQVSQNGGYQNKDDQYTPQPDDDQEIPF